MGNVAYFQSLKQAKITPPSWAFGPVWTINGMYEDQAYWAKTNQDTRNQIIEEHAAFGRKNGAAGWRSSGHIQHSRRCISLMNYIIV